jgi:hypothetical protein
MRRLAEKKDLTCPHCGKHNTEHSTVDGADIQPRHGDFTICLTCGEWSVFGEGGLSLRKPRPSEALEIKESAYCQRVKKYWKEVTHGD